MSEDSQTNCLALHFYIRFHNLSFRTRFPQATNYINIIFIIYIIIKTRDKYVKHLYVPFSF